MVDPLMMIEETSNAIRDAERELADLVAQNNDLEKRIAYLQWHLTRLRRLYKIAAQAAQRRETSVSQSFPQIIGKMNGKDGRSGTLKQTVIDVLREKHQHMKVAEIWEAVKERGFKTESNRPKDIIGSTIRASLTRNQGIFSKRGSRFGLAEWGSEVKQ